MVFVKNLKPFNKELLFIIGFFFNFLKEWAFYRKKNRISFIKLWRPPQWVKYLLSGRTQFLSKFPYFVLDKMKIKSS